jgi:OTU-like cysteine protease
MRVVLPFKRAVINSEDNSSEICLPALDQQSVADEGFDIEEGEAEEGDPAVANTIEETPQGNVSSDIVNSTDATPEPTTEQSTDIKSPALAETQSSSAASAAASQSVDIEKAPPAVPTPSLINKNSVQFPVPTSTSFLHKKKRARYDSKPPAQPMVAPARFRRYHNDSEYIAENDPFPSTNRDSVATARNPADDNDDEYNDSDNTPQSTLLSRQEQDFRLALKKRGLEIVEQEGDGNCLFRAVSLQVYGDSSMHMEVRERCMDFMLRDKEHFGTFVIGEPFDHYIARKRLFGVHGNNPEIQAIAELFNRPVEVFTPENPEHPLNIFHTEYKTSDVPIRLSYHDGNHYNAIIDPLVPTAGLGLGLPGLQPGLADKMQVAKAVAESDQMADEMELERVLKESEEDELNRAMKESAYTMDQVSNPSDRSMTLT